jgi:transcriptional regulator of acetoin/glycerol metabolism
VLTVPGSVIGLHDLPPEMRCGASSASAHALPVDPIPQGKLSDRERAEFDQICRALQHSGGNATLAAKHLGMAKSTLYLKLKKYSLDDSLDSWRSGPVVDGRAEVMS